MLSGSGQIAFFMIRTAKTSTPSSSIGIDDLGFEPGSEAAAGPPSGSTGGSTAGSTGGGSTSPPTPPAAALALQTPNPAPGQPLTLSGAGSQPGSGRIISYGWDFNGDGKIDTSTGTNPIAHVMLGPGAHTIGLTVTNSNGEHSTTHFGVTLPSTRPEDPSCPTAAKANVSRRSKSATRICSRNASRSSAAAT